MASWSGQERRKADRRHEGRTGGRRAGDLVASLKRRMDTGPRCNGDLPSDYDRAEAALAGGEPRSLDEILDVLADA